MRTVSIDIFKFSELSDKSKQVARDNHRETHLSYDWWDSIYSDFEEVAKILGLSFATKTIPLSGGKTRKASEIYFSGFHSQGDGACFVGTHSYRPEALDEIEAYAPMDLEIHRIAEAFKPGDTTITHQGRYNHEFSMRFDEPINSDPLRQLACWLYKALQEEHENLNSDESIDDYLEEADFEWTSDGATFP